ncbi:MAG: hypothetical protein M5U32_00415 [Myxococcota bacterium]|nr:hypothetical protein [Myxococcota bacterium]
MTIGIVLEETMSGWIRLDAEPVEQPFAFTIRAFTPRVFSLSTPRAFRGVVRVAGQEVPTRGVLTIRLGGPHYELDFEHPTWGPCTPKARSAIRPIPPGWRRRSSPAR